MTFARKQIKKIYPSILTIRVSWKCKKNSTNKSDCLCW